MFVERTFSFFISVPAAWRQDYGEHRHQPVELQQGVAQPLALRLGNAQFLSKVLDVGSRLDDVFFPVDGKFNIEFYVFRTLLFRFLFLIFATSQNL